MSRQLHTFVVGIMIAAVVLTGCSPSQPVYLFDDGDMSHYKGVATEIEFPDVEVCRLAEVEGGLPPLTLVNSEAREIWDLTLEDAVQYTLVNSKVMRQIGAAVRATVQGPTGFPTRQLLQNPDFAPTVYDPAIVESNPRTGVEAALSAFDTTFTASAFWERNDRPVNVTGLFTAFVAPSFGQDLGTFQSQLQKTAATGATFALRNNTQYEWNNNPNRGFPSDWNTNIEAEFRQPLMQGAGVQFNRIAGPSSAPGFFFSNGVVLARIDTDVALADFEGSVRDLLRDVEAAYWELYFAYRNLDAVIAGRDSALQTWRRIYALYVQGAAGGSAEAEAQAREQYLLFRGQVEQSLSALLTVEGQLRYIMGLAPTDGRLIRPADEPTNGRVVFDWFEVQSESLVRSVDLRRQKWQIQRREMELIASRNFLLPRLDAVGRYRWVGFGDDLIDSSGNNPPFDNAWETLTGGDFQEWQLGAQFSVPIGFRQGLAAVRNAQLRLARDRAVLQDQELQVAHQLTEALREVDRHLTLRQTNFNRRIAAARQVEAVQAAYDVGQVTLDLLLDAQRRLADAESQFFRSAVDYNLAIMEVHFHKGSLLEYNGVTLAEGPWPNKAYLDARKRARERDAAMFLNYGFTRPRVISRGPYMQHQSFGHGDGGHFMYDEGMPSEVPAEAVPLPDPIPDAGAMRLPPAGVRSAVMPASATVPVYPRTDQKDVWGDLGLTSPQQPPAQPPADDSQWKAVTRHENVAAQPVGSAYHTASEWKRAQR